jgi:hypothetical protein
LDQVAKHGLLKLATVAAYLSLENLKLHCTCFLESIVCPGLQAHNFKTMRLLRLYIIFCCLVVGLLGTMNWEGWGRY